jgi:hypothetical protein
MIHTFSESFGHLSLCSEKGIRHHQETQSSVLRADDAQYNARHSSEKPVRLAIHKE